MSWHGWAATHPEPERVPSFGDQSEEKGAEKGEWAVIKYTVLAVTEMLGSVGKSSLAIQLTLA